MAHQPLAVLISGIIGNIISFFVIFAPMTTFRQVYLRRTAAGFSSVPYVVSLFSSALWIFYALVKTNSNMLISINAAGCFFEAAYVVIYIAYAPRREKVRTVCYTLLGGAALAAVVAVSLRGVPPRHRVGFLGGVCLASSLAVFVAPLSIIVKVVRTRSAEFLPIALSVCLVLSAVAWFCYGLFTKDNFVMYPNVAGFLLSFIQVALYFWYRTPQNDLPSRNGGELPCAQREGVVELAAVVPV